jgi:protein TonB
MLLLSMVGCASSTNSDPHVVADHSPLTPPPPCYRPIKRAPPKYPAAAVKAGIEGRVLLEGTLTRDGRILDAKVVESDPPGVFDEVSVRAFSQWEYPKRRPGDPDCANPIQVEIPYSLGR